MGVARTLQRQATKNGRKIGAGEGSQHIKMEASTNTHERKGVNPLGLLLKSLFLSISFDSFDWFDSFAFGKLFFKGSVVSALYLLFAQGIAHPCSHLSPGKPLLNAVAHDGSDGVVLHALNEQLYLSLIPVQLGKPLGAPVCWNALHCHRVLAVGELRGGGGNRVRHFVRPDGRNVRQDTLVTL